MAVLVGAFPLLLITLPLPYCKAWSPLSRVIVGAVTLQSCPLYWALLCLYFTVIFVINAPVGMLAWKFLHVNVDGRFRLWFFPPTWHCA